jgi:predicted RNA binding protein YcfA (HicA-like mRNA interferase family)
LEYSFVIWTSRRGEAKIARLTSPFVVCIFPHITSAEIIKKITAGGWHLVATEGSHRQFKHPYRPGRVTVPHPKKDLPIGTVMSIERQAGVKLT